MLRLLDKPRRNGRLRQWPLACPIWERIGDLRKALDWCFSDGGDASLGIDLAVLRNPVLDEHQSISNNCFTIERAMNSLHIRCRCVRANGGSGDISRWPLTYARGSTLKQMTLGVQHPSFGNCGKVSRQLSAIWGYAHFFIWTGRLEAAFGLMETLRRACRQNSDRASIRDGRSLRAL